jgi:hypothetical protein
MNLKIKPQFLQNAVEKNVKSSSKKLERGASISRRVASTAVICLLSYFGMSGASMAGSGFSEQGNALYKALNEHLISKGICKDNRSCHNAHQIFSEDGGGHIYLNMYGQTDRALASTITEFLVARGLKITGGMPITLHVFFGPHEQYQGFKRIFGASGESIKLEISK